MSEMPSILGSRSSDRSGPRVSTSTPGSPQRPTPAADPSPAYASIERKAPRKARPRVRKIHAQKNRPADDPTPPEPEPEAVTEEEPAFVLPTIPSVASAGEPPIETAPTAAKQVAEKRRPLRKATARRPAVRKSVDDVYGVKQSRVPKNKFIGEVIEFNPNLRPTAFPTLDTPKRATEFESELASQEQYQKSGLEGSLSATRAEEQDSFSFDIQTPATSNAHDRKRPREDDEALAEVLQADEGANHAHPLVPRDQITPASTDATISADTSGEISCKVKGKQRVPWITEFSDPPKYDEETRQGWKLAGKDAYDGNIAAMETSDEEREAVDTGPIVFKTCLMKLWDKIPPSLKCHATDAMGDLFPDDHNLEHHMERLRLSNHQKDDLWVSMTDRAEQQRMAERAQKMLTALQREFHLTKADRVLTDEIHAKMKEKTIYRFPEPEIRGKRYEWRALERYFRLCGLDPGVIHEDGLLHDETGITEEGLQIDKARAEQEIS